MHRPGGRRTNHQPQIQTTPTRSKKRSGLGKRRGGTTHTRRIGRQRAHIDHWRDSKAAIVPDRQDGARQRHHKPRQCLDGISGNANCSTRVLGVATIRHLIWAHGTSTNKSFPTHEEGTRWATDEREEERALGKIDWMRNTDEGCFGIELPPLNMVLVKVHWELATIWVGFKDMVSKNKRGKRPNNMWNHS